MTPRKKNTLKDQSAHRNICKSEQVFCRGTHRIDVTQEAVGHFSWILGVFVQESKKTARHFHAATFLREVLVVKVRE